MSLRDEERSALAVMRALAVPDEEAAEFLVSSASRGQLGSMVWALAHWNVASIEAAGREPVEEIDAMLAVLLDQEAAELGE